MSILCHYTTCNGAKSIINSKTLWLRDSAYMDDLNELSCATNALLRAGYEAILSREKYPSLFEIFRFHCGVNELGVGASDPIEKNAIDYVCSPGFSLYDKLRDNLQRQRPIIYTLSLCPMWDNGRLWKRYSEGKDGAVLVFQTHKLHDFANEMGMEIKPVVYWNYQEPDNEVFESKAREIINSVSPQDPQRRVSLLFDSFERRVKPSKGSVSRDGFLVVGLNGEIEQEEWETQQEVRLLLKIPTHVYGYAPLRPVMHDPDLLSSYREKVKPGRIKCENRCVVEISNFLKTGVLASIKTGSPSTQLCISKAVKDAGLSIPVELVDVLY